mmetsp:Transcript_25184/g.59392  ORF Transcript_25184/g.59392 Transcript_25184/m.59392 type:complete len:505 (-) Transcript_25184:440-1954(-)|eukprot:CAMPEP_0172401524 /NCGR_PEP_ID=MMETSP1061-20121228/50571_1 /TAXON_ID=37318 /ORGANISM="Pseudo-nitzschia pungens, Strain cf. pungens" /LENGTH=504 /DNA_ID=CAMNT_0013135187 /DNA_START=57 /DNA_END=1571 /DNA_ORIENTATION=-
MVEAEKSRMAWSGARSSALAKSTGAKTGQQELYGKLRAYENRRRMAYSSKLGTISLYWKSYCDLLSASLRETGRAQRIVLGTSHAYGMYAEAMQRIYDDTFLDEKGNVAKDKQKKKKKQLRKKANAGDSNGVDSSTTAVAKDAVSVLKEIREAQNDLASRFEESSKNMDEEIADLIGSLLEETKESFDEIERLGSSVLVELEKTDREVSKAWDNYLKSRSEGDGTNEESSTKKAIDPWVVEMQYRVAATYQNLAWDKGNEVLSNLFSKIKQEEINRRMNLREFLVAFAQRQQRLFLDLPAIQNKVLEELTGKEMTRDDMEKAVQTIIDERASKYKRKAAGSDLVTETEDDFADFNLESPLTSDLLSKAKVVLRKADDGDWTLSLAVMSADSFLHMFDIESPRVKLTTSPEVAFTVLAPTLIIPNDGSGKSSFDRGWSDPLTPTDSLILGKCRVKQMDDNSFEVIESVSIPVTSKFTIGRTTRRRILIQTPTKEETDDWIQILTA